MRGPLPFFAAAAAALCLGVCGAAAGGLPPPLTSGGDYPFVDGFDYAGDAEAREAWRGLWGTAAVSVVETGGGTALRMPCNFSTTTMERAAWDFECRLDLTTCGGLSFKCFCPDLAPISRLSLYLYSGQGWYLARFAPGATAGWSAITVEKWQTKIEGSPAGWGKIDRIRISAWRGGDVDTDIYIADLRLCGDDAAIAVVRGESVTQGAPGELDAAIEYTAQVARHMKELDVAHVVLSDLDVSDERLADKKLVILPYSPHTPEATADVIGRYLRRGGKMICFYSLPDELGEAVGIDVGRHLRGTYDGQFASIRPLRDVIWGLPRVIRQKSWNIRRAKAVVGRSRVAAYWHDENGHNTGEAAIVVSDNCIFMTHVMLGDDPSGKERLLLAMLGHFMPDLWPQAAQKSIARIGRFGPYANALEARVAIEKSAEISLEVMDTLAEAGFCRGRAERFKAAGDYPEAVTVASVARDLMIRAYCAGQTSEESEFRAFWCHNPLGVPGVDWDAAVRLLAENGFTAIMPNMLHAGVAYYPSEVLPVAPEVKTRGDQLAECAAACRKHGVECHIWKVNWRMGRRTPKEFADRMKEAGRTQVRFDGKAENDWLCPSHPDNRQLEIDAMVEVAARYDVDGIHLDYIRYPDKRCCFCEGCRERFEAATGKKVENWPADVAGDEGIRRQWLDFRRENISRLVEEAGIALRKARPGIEISAAVFADSGAARNSVGQDWKLWCDKGWVDFVCPMNYTENNAEFQRQCLRQVSWAGKVRCYPGIGMGTWPPQDRICRLIDQIKITRRLGTGGFAVFDYGEAEAREILPLAGRGITNPHAELLVR